MTNMFRLTPFARCIFCMISVALKLTHIPVKTPPSVYLGAAHGFLVHGFVVHYLHRNGGDANFLSLRSFTTNPESFSSSSIIACYTSFFQLSHSIPANHLVPLPHSAELATNNPQLGTHTQTHMAIYSKVVEMANSKQWLSPSHNCLAKQHGLRPKVALANIVAWGL